MDWKNRVILVIDDDAGFSERISDLLVADGNEVRCAIDGLDGEDKIRELGLRLKLVIVDLAMPRRSGFEVIRNLTREQLPIRILANTGHYKAPYPEIARTLGADVVLEKPPEGAAFPPEWLDTVHRLLDLETEAEPPRPTSW